MKEISIGRNPKISKMILFASFLGAVALYIFWVSTESLKIDLAEVTLLIFYYGIFLPKMLWNVLKPKPILILSAKGIHCRYGGALPDATVSWNHFDSYRPIEIQGVPYIELRLKDEGSLVTEFPNYKAAKKFNKRWGPFPTGLFPTVFAIKPEELLTLLGQWLPRENKSES